MLAVLLRFMLIGTFVGGGVFLTARDIAAGGISWDPGALVFAFVGLLVGATLGWFLSLPLGLFPTSMAGLCYWYVLAQHTKRNPSLYVRTALGGGIGLLLSTGFGLLFSFSTAPGAYPTQVNLVSWACAGLIGGAMSALLVRDDTYTEVFKNRGVTNAA